MGLKHADASPRSWILAGEFPSKEERDTVGKNMNELLWRSDLLSELSFVRSSFKSELRVRREAENETEENVENKRKSSPAVVAKLDVEAIWLFNWDIQSAY